LLIAVAIPARAWAERGSLAAPIASTQPKIVKLYGAGGTRGLEPYQSGFLVSAEGHILTVWSYVLDTDYITAILDDGRKFEAKLAGADPKLELAVLKIEAAELPHFNLDETAPAEPGTRVLALSNLFGVATGEEPVSVQRGVVSARTKLDARRGVFETPYRGPVLVLDAMTNNPGAAGGAVIDQRGRLLGMLGKELRNSQNNIWLNYALPIEELRTAVSDIRQGKFRPRSEPPKTRPEEALDLAQLGLVLIPDVLERTPPFVDEVRPGSPAAAAGIKPDDLVVFLGDHLVQSCKSLAEELAALERGSAVRLVVMRGQQLVEVTLQSAATPATPEVK
jgi:serine protease Do